MDKEILVFFGILAGIALLFFFGPLLLSWFDAMEDRDRKRLENQDTQDNRGDIP